MHYKDLGHFIIFCLTLAVYANGNSFDSDGPKTFVDPLETLANNVCSDLKYCLDVKDFSEANCRKNFWKYEEYPLNSSSGLKPAPVQIKCIYENSIRFVIEPSQAWQIVVLVPSDDEEDVDDIIFFLMRPMEEYEEAIITSGVNYTLWSSELEDGIPIEWKGGDHVPLYSELSQPEHKDYDVNVKFIRENITDKMRVNALLSWNTTGDRDVCFNVVHRCDKTRIRSAKLWPNQKPEKLFTNLFVNDNCETRVIGLYGTTSIEYKTPSCAEYPDCLDAITVPDSADNISIEATETGFDTWEVHVSWTPPVHAVDSYNVTVRADSEWRRVVQGDETEAVFEGVTGSGLYNVSIYTNLGNISAHTSKRAQFPPRVWEVRGGAVRGAALGAACGAAIIALACCCRRRKHQGDDGDYTTDDKPSKGIDTETASVTVEWDDRWEMASDKLLLHEVIGEGAFGVVRRATFVPSGNNVAVKMLKDFPSLEEIRSFRSEMELMKSVGVHPHLVSLVGCCSGRRPLIVAEYCSRGDLLTYLRCTWDVMISKRNAKYYNNNIDTSDYRNDLFNCKIQMETSKLVVNKLYELQEICDTELTALDLLSFCRQIAMGMEFLAANRVVHRDLAARNILVTADRTLKIADFGLSRDVYEENQYKQKGNGKMPVKWMALESLTRRIYTTQSDVWSFGVVVWEVATVGAAPYASVPAARLPRLLRAGYRMPRPANCSPQLYDIMLSCWRSHPRERPTFAELHAKLDELLNSASAHQYLSLEIDPVDAPPTPKHHRYLKMLIRGKRSWSRGESYERPLQPPQSNHYTSPPVILTHSLKRQTQTH